MEGSRLNWIASFIWGIADDVLRDLYVRGKYRDVILPMTVLRRAAGQAFYNTSKFTLRDLKARASQQQLKADFEAYLDGFSPNVQDILEKFEFRNQIPRLSKADALGTLIEKFLSPDVNLSPRPVLHGDGSIKQPGLDNHGMGTVFEELVRRFNEENNEEAAPVIKKIHKSSVNPNPLVGLFEATISGKRCVVEYEPDSDLRDTEQVPLLEEGGIEAFLRREVLPYAPDAWYVFESVKIGYEISFTRCFYKPQPLRTLEEIRADILAPGERDCGAARRDHRGRQG